jgi:hypothetical protein
LYFNVVKFNSVKESCGHESSGTAPFWGDSPIRGLYGADAVRTSGLEIFGAGARITPEAIQEDTRQVRDWIKSGKLRMDIETVALQDIESVWKRDDFNGKRVVIVI